MYDHSHAYGNQDGEKQQHEPDSGRNITSHLVSFTDVVHVSHHVLPPGVNKQTNITSTTTTKKKKTQQQQHSHTTKTHMTTHLKNKQVLFLQTHTDYHGDSTQPRVTSRIPAPMAQWLSHRLME